MIRFILDKLGNRHTDLFLKLDVLHPQLLIADSYYLISFLEIESQDFNEQTYLQDALIEFINFWIERIQKTENSQQIFLPFDLSDQYIGGLLLGKTKKAFKIKKVFTEEIHGYAVSKSSLDQQIIEKKIQFKTDEDAEWLISEEAILAGLEWSINELQN